MKKYKQNSQCWHITFQVTLYCQRQIVVKIAVFNLQESSYCTICKQ